MRFSILLANLIITVVVFMSLSAYLAQDICLDRGGRVLVGSLCKFEFGLVERVSLTPLQLCITVLVSGIVGFISHLVLRRLHTAVNALIAAQNTSKAKDAQ